MVKHFNVFQNMNIFILKRLHVVLEYSKMFLKILEGSLKSQKVPESSKSLSDNNAWM